MTRRLIIVTVEVDLVFVATFYVSANLFGTISHGRDNNVVFVLVNF